MRRNSERRWSLARLVALATFVLCFGANAALADGAPLTALPGRFAVDPTGAATYAVPIAVPPGTAGMVPAMSLAYSNQNGDGVIGLGWAITGLPQITRCPRTIAQDGVHGSVNYDANDRYCLNGQRLILISGTYGADGSEYRTEIESFTRIIAHGTAGHGPAYFELHERSGEAEELGNTTDSRVLAVGTTTARIWAVNKVTDTKGNYFAVTYVNDTTNGQFYPSRIDYTGHSTAPVLAPYNSVQFVYTTRAYTTPLYHAGSLMKTTVLLSDVKTFTGATLVHDYKLAYLPGSATAPSRLSTVTLCDAASNCLPATTFGWQGSLGTLTTTATPISLAGTYNGVTPVLQPGEYNGDGLTDFLVQTPGGTTCPAGGNVFVGTLSGFVSGNFTNGSGAPYCSSPYSEFWSFPEDIDDDGLTDILTTSIKPEFDPRACCLTYTIISRANGGTSILDHSTLGGYSPAGVGDFNGDGHGDYISYDYTTSTTQIMLGDGTGAFTAMAFPGPSTALPSVPVIGDFDGDGCADELSVQVYLMCAPSVLTFAQPSAFLGYPSVIGDFNGDGMTDILYYKSGAAATLFLSTGTGFVQQTFVGGTDWDKYRISVGDWNGDGKMDLLLVAPGGTGFYGPGTPHQVWLSTGTGFVLATSLANASPGAAAAIVADWNSDGADDIWLQQQGITDSLVTLAYVPAMIKSVSNGLGAATTVAYDRLNKNGAIYTKGSGATFPTRDVDDALYVVTQVDANNGLGPCVPVAGTSGANCFTTTYAYAGAKTDLQGRGSLGFSAIISKDLQTGIVQTTAYNTAFPYSGTVASQTAVTTLTRNGCVAGKTIQSVTNTYTATNLGGTRNLVLPQQSVSAPADCDGSALAAKTVATSSYDAYGNPLVTTVTLSDGSSVTTTDTFSNDAVNWFIGRMTGTTVTKVVAGSTITRHSTFVFDPATGLMTTETIEPGSISAQQTVYGYDAFGHRITTTVSGAGGGVIAGIPDHVTSVGYDAIGQFQTSATGLDGYVDHFTYDARFGTVATHTDVNGHVTSWTYDGFARKTLETRPDGNKTAFSTPSACGGTCPGTAVSEAKAVPQNASGVQNGPAVALYYDALGRETLRTTDGLGLTVNQTTVYDTSGNIQKKSRPYPSGTPLYTSYVTDDLGRAVGATAPDTGVTTVAYHGLSSTTTNPLGQSTTTLKNAQGLVASVTDAAGHVTAYVYDAYGNLTKVTDALGNVTSNTFDVRGNKIASTDPDLGHWTYAYDALGELVTQTDAKAQVATLAYDLMGHVTQRAEADLTSTWTYGTAVPNKRLLTTETATGTAAAGAGNSRTQTYDALSRPASSTMVVGAGTGTFTTTYNADGRIDTVSYPSGFVAKYVYTALGYLSQIKDNASGAVLYTVNTRNADLSLTQGTFGNGVVQTNTYDPNTGRITDIQAGVSNGVANFDDTTDKLGNLTARVDHINGIFERFCYDNLNRLTKSALGATDPGTNCAALGGTVKTIAYDAIGDTTAKSDVGTYSYPASGATSVRPHAIGGITGTVNGVTNPTYTYDANGFMTAGAGRTVTPNSFGMTASVVQGATTVALQYGADHQRLHQSVAGTDTTYGADPASGATEDFVAPAGIWHDYLTIDGRNVAERFCTGAAPCTTGASWRYFVTDHLGSPVAITDATGAVVERDATDPWGRPRNAVTGADDPACGATPPSLTTRGFTGHERIDAICQLNANARLYDPTLGRFMAADTMVSNPLNGQALNRYAYVNNGPLSATDPSGHEPTFVPGIESHTVVGYRIPGMLDIGADGYAGLVDFGGRGTAGFSFGGWGTAVLIVPRTVTFNITSTRIPQYATVYDAFVVNFDTEQSEDSDSRDSGAAENAATDDNEVDAPVPTVTASKYHKQIIDAGLSANTSVSASVQAKILSILDPANDKSTDAAGSQALAISDLTWYLGYEIN